MAAGPEGKLQLVQRHVRAFPDFPKKGILFRDICPILKSPAALTAVTDLFEEHVRSRQLQVDLIVGLDARGFLFGPLLAQRLGVGFVLVRKKGKLPGATVSVAYDLEYGSVRNTVTFTTQELLLLPLRNKSGSDIWRKAWNQKVGEKLGAVAEWEPEPISKLVLNWCFPPVPAVKQSMIGLPWAAQSSL
uniref:adenine phosphoribosyltransferase n=1 Tax=Poecilia mexicana TaxID=48701 RepID=A0A3B3X4H5_9TELE